MKHLEEIMAYHAEQMGLWFQMQDGKPVLADIEKISRTREIALYLIGEVYDFLDTMSWKVHSLERLPESKSNIAIELVDIFKYVLTLCSIWDIDSEEFIRAFQDKSIEISARRADEDADLSMLDVVVIDIDGCLADYESAIIKELCDMGHSINKEQMTEYHVSACNIGVTKEDEEIAKGRIYETGKLRELDLIPGANEISELRVNKVLLTARPYKQFKRIYADTVSWLRHHKIEYDLLIFDAMKIDAIYQHVLPANILAVIEDRFDTAVMIANHYKCEVFMPATQYNDKPIPKNLTNLIHRMHSMHEIIVEIETRRIGIGGSQKIITR